MDAIALLKEDHRRVRDLLRRMLATTAEQLDLRHQLFELLHQELAIHARIEEDVFYPAVDAQGEKEHEQIKDSRSEHQWMRETLTRIEHIDPSDPAWKIQVQSLNDCVEHHLKEEEEELFVSARDALAENLDTLGNRMAQERGELLRVY